MFSYFPSDPRPWRAARALAETGMTVEVLCLQDDVDTALKETVDGISVFRMPLQKRRSGALRYLFEYAGFLFGATGFLCYRGLRYGYDLIHVHNMPDFLVFATLVPRLLGAKVILDMHDPMPELYESVVRRKQVRWLRELLQKVERLSMKFADLVLTPNTAFRELFLSRSCDPGKVHIVMNSPEEEVFHCKPVPEWSATRAEELRPFRLLYHGSFVERNGLDVAVEAVALARRYIPNIRLQVCGRRTHYLDGVLTLAGQKGMQDRVAYLGLKSRQEIAQLIAESDLGLVSNRSSTFTGINLPTRIFECLAMGKPVIAPDTRGIRDYFRPDQLLLFEAGNPEDLARAVCWCYDHPTELDRYIERGRRVYQQHRWSSEKARYLSLVQSLMSRNNGAAAERP